MRIDFILLCASLAVANNIELKYLPSLMGKLGGERSANSSDHRILASLRRHGVHFCSATLLSNRHALTAATCLNVFLNEITIPSFDEFSLVAGRFDIDNGTRAFKIEQVRVNMRFTYSAPSVIRNIGLIMMRENNVEVSEYVGWGVRRQIRSIPAEAAGFLVWENLDEMPRIKELELRIIRETNCGFHPFSPIMCTTSLREKLNLSEEDLGAPLIQDHVVLGILASVREKSDHFALFIDVYKSRSEIDKLFNNSRGSYRNLPPRKKARYDHMEYRNKKGRKYKIKKTNDKEEGHNKTQGN